MALGYYQYSLILENWIRRQPLTPKDGRTESTRQLKRRTINIAQFRARGSLEKDACRVPAEFRSACRHAGASAGVLVENVEMPVTV